MSQLRNYRKKMALSQTMLAERFHVDQTSISKWELGKSYPDVPIAIELSAFFGISLDIIYDNPLSFSPLHLPVVEKISPKYAPKSESELGWEEFSPATLLVHFGPDELPKTPESYKDLALNFVLLKIKSDSMAPKILPEDLILIKRQETVESNDIALISFNGANGQLYRIERHENGCALLSHNPAYPPLFLTNGEWDAKKATVLGKAVELRRQL